MKNTFVTFLTGFFLLCGCNADSNVKPVSSDSVKVTELVVKGRWLTEANGEIMLDPQTSGLISWRGQLLSFSDRSAHPSQRMRIHPIDKGNAKISDLTMVIKLAESVAKGCFASYLSDNPDLEALVKDPDDDNILYLVTEDASSTHLAEGQCQQDFSNTGSTEFPTLLLRLQLQADNSVLMTHARPIQFAAQLEVGNFPNDGIEAMAFGQQRTLYLGLEKDQEGKARIFSLSMGTDFWQQSGFAIAEEPKLKLPQFAQQGHPINGMDYYETQGRGYLLAAARNDETLWVIDTSGQQETKIIPLTFLAQVKPENATCGEWDSMDNAAIEGVAVDEQTLWLINDPWKKVYLDNIHCEQNRPHFEKMAPLLFSLPIDPKWFELD
jgi:hypothetical protein